MKIIQHIAQKAVVIKDDKLLLIHYGNAKHTSEKVANKWGFPGGKIELGEGINSSITKEVLEETGIQILPREPFHIWDWQYNRLGDTVHIVAVARYADYVSGHPIEYKKEKETTIDLISWVAFGKLKDLRFISDEKPIVKLLLMTR
jgi:mutator protein MutT